MGWTDWLFRRGKAQKRKGKAHSSDRAPGPFKATYKVRKALGINPDHSGSVDIYDMFGLKGHHDNDEKRERRDKARPALKVLVALGTGDDAENARELLKLFDEADDRKGWRA